MGSKRKAVMALAVGLIFTLAAVALAGCGGSSTTTTAAPGSSDTTTGGSTDTSASAANGASGTLVAKGLVDTPATWTVADLQKLNPVTITATHPKTGEAKYTGVKLTDLFKLLGVQAAATTLVTGSSDGYMSEIALADIAKSPEAMLGIADDGTLNMVMPGMTSGKAWSKDVTSWEFK